MNTRETIVSIFQKLLEQQNENLDGKKVALETITNFSIEIEKGVYNKTIRYADEKNIMKKWDNPIFTQM